MDLFKFFGKRPSPANVARDRLQLVLIQDRSRCNPRILELLRADLIKVISRYMDIEEGELDIQISPQGQTDEGAPTLYANIPIKNLHMPKPEPY